LTKPIFFDTDCLSAFLWTNKQEILIKLYPGRLKIPEQVYEELSSPTVLHLKKRIDVLINGKKFENVRIPDDEGEASDLYFEMLQYHPGHKSVGKGEAACVALAKTVDGVVASNNLSDVLYYIRKYNLQHLTTGAILVEALDKRLITINEGEEVWGRMLYYGRAIGANTFSDYLRDAR
jgi:predicted nucleic acid-binding protein